MGIVLLSMLIGPVAVCEEEGEGMEPEYQMELKRMEMELSREESNLRMEERLAELEVEKRELELEHARRQLGRYGGPHCGEPGVLVLIIIVVHVLTAVWVYGDIKARKCGSWMWVAIAILAGLLGTLVYAVVRIGDSTAKKKA